MGHMPIVTGPGAIGLTLLLLAQVNIWSAEAGTPQAPQAVVTLAPGLTFDAKKREVQMEAKVCLQRGVLEYLVCRQGTFEHEAVFVTTCKPSLLHATLLVIGIDPYPFMPGDGEWQQTARDHPTSRLAIDVAFEQDGKPARRRIEEFLINRGKRDRAVPDIWLFTGSSFYQEDGRNHYAADLTGAVIGLIPEGAASIQFGAQAGIPYRGEDQGLEVNTDATPAVGTKVRLLFSPHARKGERDEPAVQGGAATVTAKP